MSSGLVLLIVLVSLAVSVAAGVLTLRLSKRLDVFFKGGKAEDLESVIGELSKRLLDAEEDFKRLRNDVARIDVMAGNAVQKLGVIRFNPFEEVGSDQSFALALLDSQDNGAVISSLYTREGTRVYVKPLVKAQSRYHLSREEQEAIRRALAGE